MTSPGNARPPAVPGDDQPSASALPVLSAEVPASCEGCGVCCEGIGSPVALYASRPGEPQPHPFRPAGFPAELQQEIDSQFAGLRRGQEPQARCLWFDTQTRRCRHYEWRPAICREFELAGSSCLAVRAAAARRPQPSPPAS